MYAVESLAIIRQVALIVILAQNWISYVPARIYVRIGIVDKIFYELALRDNISKE